MQLAIALLLTFARIACSGGKAWREPRQTQAVVRREALVEVGSSSNMHSTTPCNPDVIGSVAACFDRTIRAPFVKDFDLTAPEVAVPHDLATPYGIHITPYGSVDSYLFSWVTGHAMTGGNLVVPDTSAMTAMVWITQGEGTSTDTGVSTFNGKVITYNRNFTGTVSNEFTNQPVPNNLSYLSPYLSHVLVTGLTPGTKYTYWVGSREGKSGKEQFSAFRGAKHAYPLRIGIIGDVGQTANTSHTRDHLIGSKPDVVLDVGDLSYSDNYDPMGSPWTPNGTDQKRWESYSVLWSKLFKSVPVLHTIGNHELEQSGINAVISYNTSSFEFPHNYPFQSYASRFPPAGTPMERVGSIDDALYWASTVAGVMRVIALNSYIPFHSTSAQHTWLIHELASLNRTATPWLVVLLHVPLYHTYSVHYKEASCFYETYEPLFYQFGVDLVLSGHVHAYERTHPMYKYKQDPCGPVYVTIGDGGNIEGPYRNFVDEVDPATGKTYCDGLEYGGIDPNQMWVQDHTSWGPNYQRQAHMPGCNTMTWEPASGSKSGPGLMRLHGSSGAPLFFCQSSQPAWSAKRDPSFGHGVLELKTANVATLSWYRNVDGVSQRADYAVLLRSGNKACQLAPGGR